MLSAAKHLKYETLRCAQSDLRQRSGDLRLRSVVTAGRVRVISSCNQSDVKTRFYLKRVGGLGIGESVLDIVENFALQVAIAADVDPFFLSAGGGHGAA